MFIFRSVLSLQEDSIWRFSSEHFWVRIFPFLKRGCHKNNRTFFLFKTAPLRWNSWVAKKNVKEICSQELKTGLLKKKKKIVQCFLGGKIKCFAQPSLLYNQVKGTEKWVAPDRRNVQEVSFGCHSTFTQRGFISRPPKRICGQNKLKSVEEIRLLRLYTGVNIRKPVFSWSLAKEVNFCIFSLVWGYLFL